MIVLGIESVTSHLSVALIKDKTVLALSEEAESRSHSDKIMGLIDKTMRDAGIGKRDVDLIAVDNGPGAFTSLRVGVTTARALAQFGKHPIVAVNSLDVLKENAYESGISQGDHEEFFVIPMIDARKKRVYAAIYKDKMMIDGILDIEPQSLVEKLKALKGKVRIVGDGAWLYSDFWKKELGESLELVPAEAGFLKGTHVAILAREKFLEMGSPGYQEILPNYIRRTDAEENLRRSEGKYHL